MSVGMFYLPTVAVAGLVVALQKNEDHVSSGFLDTKPRNGIIYTDSELDAIKQRRSR
jgi:hypothetical protein